MHLMQNQPPTAAPATAAAPPGAWRRNPVVRLLSSVTLGIVLMTSILIYACLFSALPTLRGALELSEMKAFQHWLFVTLVVLFCIVLTTATLVRIRLSLINLGVWTVHIGLLMLAIGSAVYFGKKVEGDIRLDTPRIEVLTLAGANSRMIGSPLPAEQGMVWQETMPAFGGEVAVEVLGTTGEGLLPVKTARLRAKVGNGDVREVALSIPDQPLAGISDRLAVRLVTAQPQSTYYDNELTALHYRRIDEPEERRRAAAIEGLPMHRERYTDEGYILSDSTGRAAPSKRNWPHLDMWFAKIPTGWFEPWRLPIALDTPDLPFRIEVTGYLPYINRMDTSAAPGDEKDGPAATIEVSFDKTRFRESLFAADPIKSMSNRANLEFRWVKDEAEQRTALAPLAGPHELTVQVLSPPRKMTLAIEPGQTFKIEGTSYELKVQELLPNWTLTTPGFENARSAVARIDVTSNDKSFNRTVVQRFPHLSQDIDEKGVRKRDGLYDPNIIMTYRTVERGWATLVAGPGLTPQLGFFGVDGSVRPRPIRPGAAEEIRTSDGVVSFRLAELLTNGREVQLPVIEPLEVRRPDLGRNLAALRIRLSGNSEEGEWSESRWIQFSGYPDESANTMNVVVPGQAVPYELIFSRFPRPLGARVVAKKLTTEFLPGRQIANWWKSDFAVEQPGGAVEMKFVQTNQTAAIGPLTLFQFGEARDHWSFTVLGVGTRDGLWPMGIGSILIPLGCLYAFYVKPILKKRKVQQALAATEARRAAVGVGA